ncbi:hypothetical protein HDK64DRAFT_312751 [Phyllosticta capitalensis]
MATNADSTGLARSNIARLPRELRDMVYGYIIELRAHEAFRGEYDGLDVVFRRPDDYLVEKSNKVFRYMSLSIVWTCKQLRKEVQELIFNRLVAKVHMHHGRSGVLSPFDLLHTARYLDTSIDVEHGSNLGETFSVKNKPISGPFSVIHDWTSRQKATLIRSGFGSQVQEQADKKQDTAPGANCGKQLWSSIVASGQSLSSEAPEPYDLLRIYPHRLWSTSDPPLVPAPMPQSFVNLFRRMSQAHRLEWLKIEFVVGSNVRGSIGSGHVHWDWRFGPLYQLPQLTRSDYGVYPYIDLISGLGRVPTVDVTFGRSMHVSMFQSWHDDDQSTRLYDSRLLVNLLRRRIEKSEQAASLRNFPPGPTDKTFDETFPRLPPSTAKEKAAPRFKPARPLDLRCNPVWTSRARNRRYRLYDDHNILLLSPLRENTYDCPDDSWLLLLDTRTCGHGGAESSSDESEASFDAEESDDECVQSRACDMKS